MSEPKAPRTVETSEEFKRFDRMARALFKVDKRDVPKHEPKKRAQSKSLPKSNDQNNDR